MRGMFGYSETMPITLYKRQKQIVDFIGQYIQKFGTSPTLQEIADSLGVSSLATVHEHLQSLAKKGVIRRYEGAVRGLELLDSKLGQAIDGIELPILGFIAAGSPIHDGPKCQFKSGVGDVIREKAGLCPSSAG